ncbi:hypothetical protein C8Q77DRAFT_1211477 [Trametes polyzona]|nr:hypothetical protein C8Q77DRAFT_1211477 [Trametes polyzona]
MMPDASSPGITPWAAHIQCCLVGNATRMTPPIGRCCRVYVLHSHCSALTTSMSSSTASPATAALVRKLSTLVPVVQCEIAVIALLAYEYMATLREEISLFWMRKKTGASWLLFTVRYHAVITYLILGGATFARMSDSVRRHCLVRASFILLFFHTYPRGIPSPFVIILRNNVPLSHLPNPYSCLVLTKIDYPFQICQYFIWAVFYALRTAALTGLNWWLASCVFILANGPFVVNVWAMSYGLAGKNEPLVGCDGGPVWTGHGDIHLPPQDVYTATLIADRDVASARLVVAARMSLTAADLTVLAVTGWYAVKTNGARQLVGPPSSLARVLVVNGSLYFLVLVVLNMIQVVFTFISTVYAISHATLLSTMLVFVDPLTAILICRFLLALQSANQRAAAGRAFVDTAGGDSEDYTGGGTLRFASAVVQSIAGPVGMDAGGSLFDADKGDEFLTPNSEEAGKCGVSLRSPVSYR